MVALVTLVVHGALYLATKTQGELNGRARKVASFFWPVQVLLTIFSLIATVYAVPHVLENYSRWPVGYVIPVLVIGSLAYLYFANSRRQEKRIAGFVPVHRCHAGGCGVRALSQRAAGKHGR